MGFVIGDIVLGDIDTAGFCPRWILSRGIIGGGGGIVQGTMS